MRKFFYYSFIDKRDEDEFKKLKTQDDKDMFMAKKNPDTYELTDDYTGDTSYLPMMDRVCLFEVKEAPTEYKTQEEALEVSIEFKECLLTKFN